MRRIVMFLVIGAVFCLFVPLASAGKKPGGGGGGGHDGGGGGGARVTTQNCEMEGDIVSDGDVQVGIIVQAYGEQIHLALSSAILDGKLDPGEYYGYARVLKKDGRLDFAFSGDPEEALDCRPVSKDDQPPFEGLGICPYELILMDGIYDRRADTVEFGSKARRYVSAYPGGILSEEPLRTGESVTITFH
jgi:hypothetical protein